MSARESLQGRLPAATPTTASRNSARPPLTEEKHFRAQGQSISEPRVRAVSTAMREGLEFLVGGRKWVLDSSRKASRSAWGEGVSRVTAEKQWALRKAPDSTRGVRDRVLKC